jgi:hypothetical protein
VLQTEFLILEVLMSSEQSVKSLCAVDLYNAANSGDRKAKYTLEAAWEEGGNQVRHLHCLIPCILASCDVELTLDLSGEIPLLVSEDPEEVPITGTCNRKNLSLDELALQARSQAWPDYGEWDIRPSDPDYMDI